MSQIFITGYSPRQCSSASAGSIGALIGAALTLCGHEVTHGPPYEYSDRFDVVLMGMSSPLAPTARYAITALSLMSALVDQSARVAVYIDDPDVSRLAASHRRIMRYPMDLHSGVVLNNRSPADRAMASEEASMEAALYGAYLISSPPCSWRSILPRHRWFHEAATGATLPEGVCEWSSVDLSPLLLHEAALIDMGIEAAERGHKARNRADYWIREYRTTSRSKKNRWIESVCSNICSPTVDAVDIRDDVVLGFCQALTALGTLEQPRSATVSGWWTPWPALTIAAGGFYATDSRASKLLGGPFNILPSYFESLPADERTAVVASQRSALRAALRAWDIDAICRTVLSTTEPIGASNSGKGH
jgi:hypothetical protein